MRYDADGSENPEFVLNRPSLPAGARSWWPARTSAAARAASTRPGRCWISASAASSRPSFADIFYNNCFKNGILPVRLPREVVRAADDDARARRANAPSRWTWNAEVIVRPTARTIPFEIDPLRRHLLLNGLDDIGLTMQQADRDRRLRGEAERAGASPEPRRRLESAHEGEPVHGREQEAAGPARRRHRAGGDGARSGASSSGSTRGACPTFELEEGLVGGAAHRAARRRR